MSMKKKLLFRVLVGAPAGVAIGYIVTILVSVCMGGADYLPCVPELAAQAGSELSAVVFQTVMCLLMGAAFGAASLIWELDRWSIMKQSLVYFAVAALIMLPTAYFCRWMEHTLEGVLLYFAIFVAIFVATWLGQYFGWRQKLKKMNAAVGEKKTKNE